VATAASTRFELEIAVVRPHEELSVQVDDGPAVALSAASLSLPAWTGRHRVRLLDAKGVLLSERRCDVEAGVERHTLSIR
jgi:hypothetical protein